MCTIGSMKGKNAKSCRGLRKYPHLFLPDNPCCCKKQQTSAIYSEGVSLISASRKAFSTAFTTATV